MLKNIPENVKVLITTTAPLIVVVLLFFFVGQFGFSKISEVRLQIAGATKNQNTLTQKLGLLRTVSNSLATSATFASNALPEANPTLVILAQLRSLATQNTVIISGVKGGPEVSDATGLSRVDITLDASGSRDQVLAFMKNIQLTAPITHIDKIKLNEANGQVRANLALRIFWSPLPTKLPAFTDQITDLTQDEKNILSDLSNLAQPNFEVAPAPTAGGKADPFTP